MYVSVGAWEHSHSSLATFLCGQGDLVALPRKEPIRRSLQTVDALPDLAVAGNTPEDPSTRTWEMKLCSSCTVKEALPSELA